MRLVLASGSPRRKELLSLIEEEFVVHPVDADESVPNGMPVDIVPSYLADCKASLAAANYPEDLVIGCDTIVVLGDVIMGKPRDREDARHMLTALSGETHRVLTGVSLHYRGHRTCFTKETLVTFLPLTSATIEWYLATNEPFDKAGAYGIQGKGTLLVEGIEGDFFNVVGLPVSALKQAIDHLLQTVQRPKVKYHRS